MDSLSIKTAMPVSQNSLSKNDLFLLTYSTQK